MVPPCLVCLFAFYGESGCLSVEQVLAPPLPAIFFFLNALVFIGTYNTLPILHIICLTSRILFARPFEAFGFVISRIER